MGVGKKEPKAPGSCAVKTSHKSSLESEGHYTRLHERFLMLKILGTPLCPQSHLISQYWGTRVLPFLWLLIWNHRGPEGCGVSETLGTCSVRSRDRLEPEMRGAQGGPEIASSLVRVGACRCVARPLSHWQQARVPLSSSDGARPCPRLFSTVFL